VPVNQDAERFRHADSGAIRLRFHLSAFISGVTMSDTGHAGAVRSTGARARPAGPADRSSPGAASRLAAEDFHIVEARLRVLAPHRLEPPFADATMGPFHVFQVAEVALRDADGVEGASLAGGLPFLEHIVLPALLTAGRTTHAALHHRLYWSIRNAGFRGPAASALGAVDVALADLAARRARLPLHRYLGAGRDVVEVYGSGGGTGLTDRELVEQMASYAGMGYRCVKMKVASDFGRAVGADVARVRAVRAAIGPDIRLAVDANQAFTAEEALDFARRIADADIAWFEEPVHSADLRALADYAAEAPIPAAVGESETSGRVFPSLADAGTAHLQAMPSKLTSVAEWLAVRDLTAERGLALTLPGYPWIGAPFAATAAPATMCEYLMPVLGFIETLAAEAPRLTRGTLRLGEEPGLELRLDWERLARSGRVVRDARWTAQDVAGVATSV